MRPSCAATSGPNCTLTRSRSIGSSARPTAMTIRPQLASSPAKAVLTSGLSQMVRAILRALAELAAPDSALFLWATFPQLPEALRLIQAWGFTYKSVAFVWLKQNRKSPGWFYGLGFWTRGNAEVCLLATRGHPKRQAANVHQFIISPVREHSRKPEEAREKIVALMGDLPRVELFARQSPPGWDVWGNEVEPTIPDFWTKCPEAADQKEDL